MPISRETLEEALARLNAQRKADEQVALAEYAAPGRFVLSFPNRSMPEGQCIDQDFTEIQFDLHERARITTGIQGARQEEASGRFLIEYEVVEWD